MKDTGQLANRCEAGGKCLEAYFALRNVTQLTVVSFCVGNTRGGIGSVFDGSITDTARGFAITPQLRKRILHPRKLTKQQPLRRIALELKLIILETGSLT